MADKTGGSMSSIVTVSVHVLSSLKITEYVPGQRFSINCDVSLVFHIKLNGGTPTPITFNFASQKPVHDISFTLTKALHFGGSIVIGKGMLHP